MKTRRIITALGLFLAGTLVHAQEKRTVSSFSKIEVGGNIELIYTETLAPSIKVDAENDADVSTDINKGILKIRAKNQSGQPMKVYVTGNDLAAIKAESGAAVFIKNQLSHADFDLALHSGATFSGYIKSVRTMTLRADEGTAFVGRIDAGTLEAKFSADARAAISGSAAVAEITTGERALCLAGNFAAEKLTVHARGFSLAKVHARRDIDIAVSDKGQVGYTGTPAHVKMNESAVAFDSRSAAMPIASK